MAIWQNTQILPFWHILLNVADLQARVQGGALGAEAPRTRGPRKKREGKERRKKERKGKKGRKEKKERKIRKGKEKANESEQYLSPPPYTLFPTKWI